ncbi:23S rRNA (pseudouridine(1915)-N(3))-methyltransferase RlmH [Clostridium luticellarii]|jgi:23S rRNA (pseudouridine1915-N3)-methyltransferase|uniref:Ribosomal RNA large subunit methyltransferase H n=1 Tax=Clostridium luticellarii TaxID=1691940 RepID=A0A2T0BMN2_9CLOT|nr:23S rRNA (pseudouridine(1915)-N(3))-methyltransferase RlmH [Clostridium luticellarii]MCI1946318.1 23S rRNA (pseudouridine(1915)-N(3))-methyltransferase RlmH [Clostridium luticellarii]MCI1969543.1 23S rRNA (pseudouridine(1915)-N(3))-methyltransferase RlmH [Clostridium luticellarii]PRR85131.1 Ribosomal RNA large subunit methyltransferase H [Clostridium luticellarii]
MNITIISVGKLKEKYLKDAAAEYSKRLSRYCKLNIIEVMDEKTPESASEKEEDMIREKEGKKILKYLKEGSYVIALDLKGSMMSSVEFAHKVQKLALEGNSSIIFMIGGSLGISEEILQKSNCKLCFSKMTFPHQLFRIMLLEQIYRAFKILRGEPYHK